MTEEIKENKMLEVVRYVRPTRIETINTNLYGITFVFNIDYTTRLVHVQWSVCNGDNFNKYIGTKEAKKRKSFCFPLEDVKGVGLVNAFMKNTFREDTVVDLLCKNYFLFHDIMGKMTRYVTEGSNE